MKIRFPVSIQGFSDFRFRLREIALSPTNLIRCTLVFMIFAFAAIFTSSYHRIEQQRSMVERFVSDRARHTSGAFDDWVRSQLQMLTVLGMSAVLQADRPANVKMVADAALRGTRAWESVSVYDGETGATIAETGSPLLTGVRKAMLRPGSEGDQWGTGDLHLVKRAGRRD